MTRRWVSVLAALVAAALLLPSCGDGNGKDGGRTPAGSPTAEGPVTVTIWHSMPDPAQGAFQRIADEFNESQNHYEVVLIFQGGYTESLNKLISSVRSGDVPALIQLSDAATQIMIDSYAITPVQRFVDEEEYDLSDFEPKALGYYRADGTLYSMPFNLSGPILYYDRQAFEEAGLDPDRPPRTLAEVREYSERLLVRNEEGEVTRRGISLQISAWVFEQMLAKAGDLYVNNGNGRDGRATEAVFDGEQGVGIIEWWDRMVDDGLAYNAGTDGTDAMLKLASEEVAMSIASTAALRAVIGAVILAGRDPTRYDTGPMPGPEGEGGGIVLGGAALWIMKDRPEEEQRGAWEFLKFASSPEQQAQWHSDTGYFPTRLSSYDLPPAVAARRDYPQFETAVQQLRDSPDSPATEGALVGPFSSVRDRVTQAFELVLAGGADPAGELAAAAEDATEIIREYNRTAP